jgi:hypothetical protein
LINIHSFLKEIFIFWVKRGASGFGSGSGPKHGLNPHKIGSATLVPGRLLDPPTQLAVDLAMQALKDIGALQLDGQNLLITHFFL